MTQSITDPLGTPKLRYLHYIPTNTLLSYKYEPFHLPQAYLGTPSDPDREPYIVTIYLQYNEGDACTPDTYVSNWSIFDATHLADLSVVALGVKNVRPFTFLPDPCNGARNMVDKLFKPVANDCCDLQTATSLQQGWANIMITGLRGHCKDVSIKLASTPFIFWENGKGIDLRYTSSSQPRILFQTDVENQHTFCSRQVWPP
ncbi:hypothetical protein B0H14DRAFT_3153443 [Mycena olivaceomarginata]|nr:hypothetical protein B0H14DRAFT_3153443 [Mycena olivaceomarginata]